MSLGGAALAALGASICCVAPVVLMTMGAGTAWVSRLNMLEPYRPILIALSMGLLGFAFYRVCRPSVDRSCSQDGQCERRMPSRINRTAFWVISTPILTLLALPAAAKYLHIRLPACHGVSADHSTTAALDQTCCILPATHLTESPAIDPQTRPVPSDPARDAIFSIETLQCPAVKGVGCGSMLWPVLIRIDQIDGVSCSFTNWTGTRLRISVKSGSDPRAVAERVRAFLSADGRHPTALAGAKSTDGLRSEKWYSATGLVTLSSYEFNTIAKRRINAFADDEKLTDAQREKLMKLVDQLWDKAAEGIALPDAKDDAYGRYWHARLRRFLQSFAAQARSVLSADQIERLLQPFEQKLHPNTNNG